MATSHAWVDDAVGKINADFNRSSDTHLFRLDIPGLPGIPRRDHLGSWATTCPANPAPAAV